MDEHKTQLKEKLAESREQLLELSRELDRETWTQPVYSHGEETEWSAMDLLRHLAWAESGMLRLMEMIRAGEEGVPADFDLDRYNASGVKKLKDEMPAELLRRMQRKREQLLAFVDELDEADWQKSGRHGTMKIMTIPEIVATIAAHEAQHLDDLRQALQSES